MVPSALPARIAPASVSDFPSSAAPSSLAPARARTACRPRTTARRKRCCDLICALRSSEGSLEAQVEPAAVVLPPAARTCETAARSGAGRRVAARVSQLDHVLLAHVEL